MNLVEKVRQILPLHLNDEDVLDSQIAYYDPDSQSMHLGSKAMKMSRNEINLIIYHELAHAVGHILKTKVFMRRLTARSFLLDFFEIATEELIAIEVSKLLSIHFNEFNSEVVASLESCESSFAKVLTYKNGLDFKYEVNLRYKYILENILK